ncbi:MAG: LysR family transcriptional regulator [Deltaproteobacteria bacterium]|nr:LysR family transcriptional regulator [Deltaproteobacteria bacterium]
MPKQKLPIEENAVASGPQGASIQIKGRLWLEKEGKTFLSWGRVLLLEHIAKLGSVAAAARSLGMSYSHAWNMVEEMNCLAPAPLVEKQTGGAGGGGAQLTAEGQRTIEGFRSLVADFQTWVDSHPPGERF